MIQEAWQLWRRFATPAAQVVLDHAMERAAKEPEHPGYRWARRCMGESGEAPIWGGMGEEGQLRICLVPGISWEDLAEVNGDISRIVARGLAPLMQRVKPGSFRMSGEDAKASCVE